jgi:hypothetical protein
VVLVVIGVLVVVWLGASGWVFPADDQYTTMKPRYGTPVPHNDDVMSNMLVDREKGAR